MRKTCTLNSEEELLTNQKRIVKNVPYKYVVLTVTDIPRAFVTELVLSLQPAKRFKYSILDLDHQPPQSRTVALNDLSLML